jgi:phospholipid/cholesterol/gamma-HCH transport system substrate-binding protein
MNERMMQFRIGMFVLVAGLVLVIMIVMFEAPALLRNPRYVTVYFPEAPGINKGIPVRRSGVRVGEVFSFEFTPPEDKKEGVLVTLSLDPHYPIRDANEPKLQRALVGDVSIDLIPGPPGTLRAFSTPAESMKPENRVDGLLAVDPFALISGASKIFDNAEGTLKAIELAANGLTKITDKADSLDEFLETWSATGKRLDSLATDVGRIVKDNEADIKPAVTSLRNTLEKVDGLLTQENREKLRQTFEQLGTSFAKLNVVLDELEPVARDLSAAPGEPSKTNLGQALARINRVVYDLNLLTSQLSDASGQLNRNGTLQQLVSDRQLYDDLRTLSRAAESTMGEARVVLGHLRLFAEKISRNPSMISEGVLAPR